MYKNRAGDGRNNICGKRIREFRLNLPEKTSQRELARMMQLAEIDIDKNAIQRIESGDRFVTDIELRVFAQVLKVSYEDLLDDETKD